VSRYFTRQSHHIRRVTKMVGQPRAERDDAYPMIPHLDVPEHEAVETGLVDERGEMIWRAPNPIGFGRDGEW
jgi:hypothetical protein